MQFTRHTPSLPLDGLVECFVHFSGFMPDHRVERMVPSGNAFIVVELDGMLRHTFDPDTLEPLQSFSGAWFAGIHLNHLAISALPGSEMFVVQFAPAGALPFVQSDLETYTGKVVGAGDVFGESAWRLRDGLLSAATAEDKMKVAEMWLLERFRPELAPPAALTDFITSLRDGRSGASLPGTYPHSRKHLISQCRKYTGARPKDLQRIFRFNAVIAALSRNQPVSWAALADEFGYADQSHFIREFVRFSGFTPHHFMNRDLTPEEMRFIPLDKTDLVTADPSGSGSR